MRISDKTLVKYINKNGFQNRALIQINRYLLVNDDIQNKYKYDYDKFFKFLMIHRITIQMLAKEFDISIGLIQHWKRGYIGYEDWLSLINVINNKYKITDEGLIRFETDITKEDFITEL